DPQDKNSEDPEEKQRERCEIGTTVRRAPVAPRRTPFAVRCQADSVWSGRRNRRVGRERDRTIDGRNGGPFLRVGLRIDGRAGRICGTKPGRIVVQAATLAVQATAVQTF